MTGSVLFCTNCGQMNEANAVFCSRCGARQPVAGQGASVSSATSSTAGAVPVQQAYASPVASGYAGFWLRFVAFIIDTVVIWVVTWPLRILLFGFFPFRPHVPFDRPDFHMMMPFFFGMALFTAVIRLFAGWLYWAGMESSTYQATLGKMALGLKVTDLAGNRISFARASGRYFGKILSSMILLIGYIMAGFTERKQALHDMLAGTLVLRK